MASEEYGAVIEVSTTNLGAVFAVAAIVGATAITLDDVSPFEELGGQVYIAGTTYYYTAVDADLNTMTLLTGLVTAATADETRVEIYPPAPHRTAMVAFGIEEGEAVRVTIPHFFSGMPDGVRTAEAQEIALVEERNPGELYLKDVMAKGMILLGPGEDLDGYVSEGRFIQMYDAAAAGGANYPVPYAGILEVLSTQPADIMVQRYTAYQDAGRVGPSAWVRTYGLSVWSVWEQVGGSPPAGSMTLTTGGGQNISDAVTTAVQLNNQRDLVGMSWNSTSRWFVIERPGRYQINGGVTYTPGGTTGRCEVKILEGGIQRAGNVQPFPSAGGEFVSATASYVQKLAVNDTIQLATFQNSGATRTLHVPDYCWLDVTYLSPY